MSVHPSTSPPSPPTAPVAPTPEDDARWRAVDATMRRHGYDSHALIETLHVVQREFGYLHGPAMRYVAQGLRLPLSKVYGVATFYHFFTLVPPAKHKCIICLGTACYLKGGGQVLDELSSRLGIHEGETTPDGALCLISARCIGACGLAPLAVVDRQYMGREPADCLLANIERKLSS